MTIESVKSLGLQDVHATGMDVWVRDEKEGWVKAKVTRVDGSKVTVQPEAGAEKVVEKADCPLQNSDARGGVEDMTQLNHLHEPGVLWNLRKRYLFDNIYTYTGNILIAVNPFQSLAHLYGTHMMEMYKGQDLGELSPHVYATAEAAFRQMVSAGKSQSILVSGESGAGKTETCKLIMKYLAFLGGYAESAAASQFSGSGVESKVLESNPLLEAFGNAKTVRNDNSSRFGKFTEIQFDSAWRIVGAAVRTYLLERSRVVTVNDPERNYHVFYQLCAGATEAERMRMHLSDPRDFKYLNRSSCYEIPRLDNAKEYVNTRRAMSIVGIRKNDQDAIFNVVAAVLHLGNVNFVVDDNDDMACKVENNKGHQHLTWAAELLGVPAEGLLKALSTRTRQTPDGAIISPITADAAISNRDSLAKTIYSRLFDYLVEQVNVSIGHTDSPAAVVGVLDIYGFEQFKVNDFEQFCINLANEKLQQHFNQHVFKMEQAEYEAEEIDWTHIEFVDNQDVLDLIERKPLGLLDSLDETCRFPQADGNAFADKLYSNKDIMGHKRFSKPKRSNRAFIIDHYAGQVEYQVDNFLDKNKDFVVKEHQDLLGASTLSLVSGALFKPEPAPAEDAAASGPPRRNRMNAAYKFVSVGSQFKKQLAALMTSLSTMEPHYVRCIKPNAEGQPNMFGNVLVLQQLRCGGVLEAVRISCAGYPSRRLFFDFVEHFWHLAPEAARSDAEDKTVSESVCKNHLEGGYVLGRTKVFLKGGQMAVLEKHRTNLLNASAVTVQKYVRGFLQGRHYRQMRKAVVLMQSYARRAAAMRLAEHLRREKAALIAQKAFRRARAMRMRFRGLAAAKLIQAMWRGRVARRLAEEMRRNLAAICIQKWARGHAVRSALKLAHRRATRIQCIWRVKVAKRQLRSLRTEARSAGKLMEDKNALEQRLKEMQGIVAQMQSSRAEDRARIRMANEQRDAAVAEVQRRSAAAEAAARARLAEMERQERRMQKENKELTASKTKLAEQVTSLESMVSKLNRELTDLKESAEASDEKHKHEMNRLRAERERNKKEALEISEDLMQRLQNACAQRDEAREQVLALEAALEAQRTDTEAKLASVSKAAALAASKEQFPPAPPGPPPPQQSAGAPAAPPATPPRNPLTFPSMSSFMTPTGGESNLSAPQLRDNFSRVTESIHSRASGLWSSPPSSVGAPVSTPSRALPPVSAPGGAYESELDRRQNEMQVKQAQFAQEQRSKLQDALVDAIQKPLGFYRGRPVAAIVIFRCAVQWQAFQADRTNLFDRIITTIGEQIEARPGSSTGAMVSSNGPYVQVPNSVLCYWLTNTVTLLLLIQRNVKPAATQNSRRMSSGTQQGGLTSFASGASGAFSRFFTSRSRASMANNGDASIHGGSHGGFRQIAAKYPALLFKQQLDACMGKIFPMLRDNIKKDVQAPLQKCIHASKTAGHSRSLRPTAAMQEVSPWSQLLSVLDDLRKQLKENEVPAFLQRKLFMQLFSFINVQLFNQLLLRRECCSFANGEYVKNGLAQVEEWVSSAGDEIVGSSWDELRFIRQAVTFLVLHQKQKKTLSEIRQDLCPELSVQQLYRISTMYWDDKYNTETVSGDVLQEMRTTMQSQQGSAAHSFLLDDDSANPFNAEDIKMVDDKDLYDKIPIPEPLKENRGFEFLQRELKLTPQG